LPFISTAGVQDSGDQTAQLVAVLNSRAVRGESRITQPAGVIQDPTQAGRRTGPEPLPLLLNYADQYEQHTGHLYTDTDEDDMTVFIFQPDPARQPLPSSRGCTTTTPTTRSHGHDGMGALLGNSLPFEAGKMSLLSFEPRFAI